MKMKTLGLLSTSLVVAQLMSLNIAQASTQAMQPEFVQKTVVDQALLTDSAYEAPDSIRGLQNIQAAIGHSQKLIGANTGFSHTHIGLDGLTPHTNELAEHQSILHGGEGVHRNQKEVIDSMKKVYALLSPTRKGGISYLDTSRLSDYDATADKVETHSKILHMVHTSADNVDTIKEAHDFVAEAHSKATPDDQEKALSGIRNTLKAIRKTHEAIRTTAVAMASHYTTVAQDAAEAK